MSNGRHSLGIKYSHLLQLNQVILVKNASQSILRNVTGIKNDILHQ